MLVMLGAKKSLHFSIQILFRISYIALGFII